MHLRARLTRRLCFWRPRDKGVPARRTRPPDRPSGAPEEDRVGQRRRSHSARAPWCCPGRDHRRPSGDGPRPRTYAASELVVRQVTVPVPEPGRDSSCICPSSVINRTVPFVRPGPPGGRRPGRRRAWSASRRCRSGGRERAPPDRRSGAPAGRTGGRGHRVSGTRTPHDLGRMPRILRLAGRRPGGRAPNGAGSVALPLDRPNLALSSRYALFGDCF
jgi:hypothetical protein